MKFRKKPIVIDAVQWRGKKNILAELGSIDSYIIAVQPNGELLIETLEGHLFASLGDWIIKGVKGEIYPCKDDIFTLTYEPVPGEDGGET